MGGTILTVNDLNLLVCPTTIQNTPPSSHTHRSLVETGLFPDEEAGTLIKQKQAGLGTVTHTFNLSTGGQRQVDL